MRYIPVIKISRRKCFLIAKYLKILNSQLQYCIQPNLCVRTIYNLFVQYWWKYFLRGLNEDFLVLYRWRWQWTGFTRQSGAWSGRSPCSTAKFCTWVGTPAPCGWDRASSSLTTSKAAWKRYLLEGSCRIGFVSGDIWMGKVSVKRVMEIDEFCGRGASTKQIGKVFVRGN